MALVTQFLTQIRAFVISLDGDNLAAYLQVEPNPGAPTYFQLRDELKTAFSGPKALEKLVDNAMPEVDDPPDGTGSPWPSFVAFVKEYLLYWRDANFDDLVDLQEMLSILLTSCATALSHPQYGSLMFKTSISLSEALSKVVMMLHKQPELMAGRRIVTGDEDSKSMIEQSADILQKIFTSCLSDRSSTRFAKPEGKKVGVYIFANLILRLLFTCGKSRLAAQMLTNLSTQGPPLQIYPAAQRVTFLYYLGRFNFDCDQYVRAEKCLQEAYFQTPPPLVKHRARILTYLVASNIMLGRFPSASLLSRPDAAGLGNVFLPILAAVQKGNFIAFQEAVAANERWLYHKGLLFALQFRLRPLVWRSFTRRVFLLTYQAPSDGNNRVAPTVNLSDIFTAACYVQRRLEGYIPAPAQMQHGSSGANPLVMMAVQNNVVSRSSQILVPPAGGQAKKLKPSEGLFWGNLPVSMKEVEGVVAGLAAQGLMNGFLAHSSGKFAIMGAKKTKPLEAGWPSVAAAIQERLAAEEAEEGLNLQDVPAWVKTPPGFV